MKETKQISTELNHLLWETLELYKPFESPRICFFSSENIYDRLPGLVFRFKNATSEDYVKLQNCLETFTGNEKWICYKLVNTIIPTSNYIIETKSSYDLSLENELSFDKIKITCDKAFDDMIPLCEHLNRNFKL